MGVLDVVKAGVLSGDDVTRLYKYAKEQGFAIPAVNVVGSDSVNAVLEAAKRTAWITRALITRFFILSLKMSRGHMSD